MATRVKKVARKRASSTRGSSKSMSKRAERVVKRLFVSPVENLTRRTALDVPPQTSLRQMEQDLDRASAALGRDEICAFFEEMLNEIRGAPEPLPPVPIPTAASSVELSVFTLFDTLDATLPFGTMALLVCGVGIGRPRHAEIAIETERLATNVAAVDGELRALRLKEFAQHVLEYEYGPFVHTLLQAVWATRGDAFRKFESIGNTLNEVKQHNILGADLWIEAARVRNATAHRGGWRFDIDKHLLVLHDERKNGQDPWTQEFAVDDLFDQLMDAVNAARVLETTVSRVFKRDMIALIMPGFVHALKTGDETMLDAQAGPFISAFQHAWETLLSRGWSQAV